MEPGHWFLDPSERGNPATQLDRRHRGGRAWTSGNEVRPLIHGAAYFAALLRTVGAMRRGDLLLFADWRGDPDERLDSDGTDVNTLFCDAARRGVLVRGLVWRSHLDRLQFSEQENRHLGEDINLAGGICLLDMRVRPGGSHHQKFVVLRHPDRPELDRAFLGGIDLCHSRRDDAIHAGDGQRQAMAAVYGPRPPWHDVQVELRGPAVGDVESSFRERWNDPAPLSRNPVHLLRDRMDRASGPDRRLPAQLPDPAPSGSLAVQILRTYPDRRPGYPFAPRGERSVARGLIKAVGRARRLIYIENQYLWSRQVIDAFCRALEAQPGLLLIAVLPRFPDQDGRFSKPPNLVGLEDAMKMLVAAGGRRVATYGLENHSGTPVYVHAKVCVIDDEWAKVGSDNLNRRSWSHDSEMACAVVDESGAVASFARRLRLELVREHLDRDPSDDDDLGDANSCFAAFSAAAADLDAWHASGQTGPRPAGRLRYRPIPELSRRTRMWSAPAYRLLYDPDGRPRALRRAGAY